MKSCSDIDGRGWLYFFNIIVFIAPLRIVFIDISYLNVRQKEKQTNDLI